MGCFKVDRANNRDTVKRLDNVVSKIKNGPLLVFLRAEQNIEL